MGAVGNASPGGGSLLMAVVYGIAYLTAASTIILLNKHVLSVTPFHYPIALASLGVLFGWVASVILVHTGAWANASGWTPDQPMPNSAGCVHTHPSALQLLGELLKSRCGVVARPNTDGRLPYPFSPQGLAVVYELAS